MRLGCHSCGGVRGGILLEVLFALALMLGASSVITGGLQASMDAVERMRNGMHGVNLAESLLSKIEMGLLDAESVEEESFSAPFESWSYDIEVEDLEEMSLSSSDREIPVMQRVEVAIHNPEGKVVYRMSQLMMLPEEDEFSMGVDDEGGTLSF